METEAIDPSLIAPKERLRLARNLGFGIPSSYIIGVYLPIRKTYLHLFLSDFEKTAVHHGARKILLISSAIHSFGAWSAPH